MKLLSSLQPTISHLFISVLLGILFWLSPQTITCQNVYEGDISFYSQSDLDEWPTYYTSITGSMTILGSDITTLSPLQNITSVEGDVWVLANPVLQNLHGLNGLDSIGGNLLVSANDLLANLIELNNLTSIGGGLFVSANGAMTSFAGLNRIKRLSQIYLLSNNAQIRLTGLDSLTTIWGDGLSITSNGALQDLTGLGALTSVSGTFGISSNNILTSLTGVSSLTSISYNLVVSDNDNLTSLTGLESLTTVEDISISGNPSLISLTGLEGITSVDQNMTIQGNNSLTNLSGLSSLTSVGISLYIEDNLGLTNLAGLNLLTHIGNNLVIQTNGNLSNLNGLNFLSGIGSDLQIYNNTLLNSLNGLENLTSIGSNLSLTYNPVLSNCCAIYTLLNTPGAINGTITIQNNQTGCDSQTEVCDLDGDLDDDGFTASGGDCDDLNADVHPGALEVCGNDVDDDCDGAIDEEYTQIHIIKDNQQNVSCNGYNDGAINIHVNGGLAPYTYEWNNGTINEDVTFLFAGVHTVTVADALGRCRTKAFIVTQPSQIYLTFTHIDVSCSGNSDGEATVESQGGTGSKTYLWSNGATTKKIKNVPAGYYSIIVTDHNGCFGFGGVYIGEPLPLTIFNVSVSPTGANYQLIVEAAGGTPAFKYRRSKPNGSWTPWQTSNVFNTVPAGVYTIQVKDNNDCKTSVQINVPGLASPQLYEGGEVLYQSKMDTSRNIQNLLSGNSIFIDTIPFTFQNNVEKFNSGFVNILTLYPNPASNQLFLYKKEFVGHKAMVTIINNQGVVMKHQKIETMPAEALALNVFNLTTGNYCVIVNAEGCNPISKYFVIVK